MDFSWRLLAPSSSQSSQEPAVFDSTSTSHIKQKRARGRESLPMEGERTKQHVQRQHQPRKGSDITWSGEESPALQSDSSNGCWLVLVNRARARVGTKINRARE